MMVEPRIELTMTIGMNESNLLGKTKSLLYLAFYSSFGTSRKSTLGTSQAMQ